MSINILNKFDPRGIMCLASIAGDSYGSKEGLEMCYGWAIETVYYSTFEEFDMKAT